MANRLNEKPIVIFDTTNKALNSMWLAEYQVKNNCSHDDAIVAANDSLRRMLWVFGLQTEKQGATEAFRTQLEGLKSDIEEYLRAVDLFEKIRCSDYRSMMTKGDPSFFATSGSVTGVRIWGLSVAEREGISPRHLTMLFAMAAFSLKSLTVEQFDFEQEVPELESVAADTPSLEWVIDYHFRHDVSYEDAHIKGCELLLLEQEGDGTLTA